MSLTYINLKYEHTNQSIHQHTNYLTPKVMLIRMKQWRMLMINENIRQNQNFNWFKIQKKNVQTK